MPHLNGSRVWFGIQLRCGQYLTLQSLEQERGFSPGCASVLGNGVPSCHPSPLLPETRHGGGEEESRRKSRMNIHSHHLSGCKGGALCFAFFPAAAVYCLKL